MPGNNEMGKDTGMCSKKNDELGQNPELGQHYNGITHFSLDSRNENLPEKHMHQNCAEMPGRETAPGFLLRGRDAPARGVFFALQDNKTRRETMTFHKGE